MGTCALSYASDSDAARICQRGGGGGGGKAREFPPPTVGRVLKIRV